MQRRFGFVDVFADRALAGNPLAVVEDAGDFDDDLLKRIAAEFNQAETTFLMPSASADWKLRSFTADGSEVFGAGHNALGAWLWLADRGLLGSLDRPTTFCQEIGANILPITISAHDGRFTGAMTQAPLFLGRSVENLTGLAASLGLDVESLDTHPPARIADTGAPHLMVRARDKQAVDRARPSAIDLLEILRSTGAQGCYLYAIDASDAIEQPTAYARFFNPTVGLWEDSATGTAAGPLTAYLASERVITSGRLVVEQGSLMGRPSFLEVHLDPDAVLSGSGVVSVRGTMHL